MQTIDIKEKNGLITQYVRDQFGVIKQLYPERYIYDANYCSTYDKPEYERKSQALQRLRLGFVEAMQDREISSLLDCGYGNGAFLKYVEITKTIEKLFGYDISGVPVPAGCEKLKELRMGNTPETVDVTTFWDCIEHFPDLSFVADLNTRMIVVSLPWCHFNYYASGDYANWTKGVANSWFTSWHHRKPNEHLYHFDKQSLIATMASLGWKCKATSNLEDVIRKGADGKLPNILTAAFARK